MSRKLEYGAYLRSSEWQSLRERALRITGGFCLFCSSPAEEVHHVRYPKAFAQDSIFNLQPLCRRHHMEMHGMPNIVPIKEFDVVKFEDRKFIAGKGNDKFLGTTIKNWNEVFHVPSTEQANLARHFEDELREMETVNDGLGLHVHLVREINREVGLIYSWKIARRAVHALSIDVKAKTRNASIPEALRVGLRTWWQDIHKVELRIDEWVESLLRGEVVSLRHAAHKPQDRILTAVQLLAEEQAEQRAKLKEHDEVIVRLQDPKAPLMTLPEPAAAIDAIIAMRLVPWSGTPTLDQVFGKILAKRYRGPVMPKKTIRSPTQSSSIALQVNTYPRQHIIDCWDEFYAVAFPSAPKM